MMYEELIADFAQRTEANLKTIRHLAKENSSLPAYEVTQLVNSMLGLLIFPQQKYIDRIPNIPLADLEREGWPIPQVVGDHPQVSDLRQLVRMLRNAIAHCNLEFIAGGSGEIYALELWNKAPSTGEATWRAQLTVDDLDAITTKFVALLLDWKKHP